MSDLKLWMNPLIESRVRFDIADNKISHLQQELASSQDRERSLTQRVKALEDALRPLVKNVDRLCYLYDDDLTMDNLHVGYLRHAAKLLEKK